MPLSCRLKKMLVLEAEVELIVVPVIATIRKDCSNSKEVEGHTVAALLLLPVPVLVPAATIRISYRLESRRRAC